MARSVAGNAAAITVASAPVVTHGGGRRAVSGVCARVCLGVGVCDSNEEQHLNKVYRPSYDVAATTVRGAKQGGRDGQEPLVGGGTCHKTDW